MPELDFTKLNKIASREHEADRDNPFLQDINPAAQTASEPPTASPLSNDDSTQRQASERKKTAFTSASGTRNYKALYRVAHDYHVRQNPPTVDREYWQTHIPGEDIPSPAEMEYWKEAAKDMSATAEAYGNDPFLKGLLITVYEELEREYQDLRAKAQDAGSETV